MRGSDSVGGSSSADEPRADSKRIFTDMDDREANGWTFVASGRLERWNWEAWLEPDPFGRGRRCERFFYSPNDNARFGSGACGYELPLDFGGPSKEEGFIHGIVTPKAVRIRLLMADGTSVDPELVKPLDVGDRLYFAYAGVWPKQVVAYDGDGRVVARKEIAPPPEL